MSKTREQIESYVRAKLSELDNAKVDSAILYVDVNFAQQKVVKDLMPIVAKRYVRVAYNDEHIFNLPSDIWADQNAVIDLKVANGTKGSGSFTSASGSNNNFTITARQPGTASFTVRLVNTASIGQSPTVSYDYANSRYNIAIEDTVTLVNNIVSAINSDPNLSEYIVASTSNGSGAIVLSGVSGINTISFSVGTGDGWIPATEVSEEDFNRQPNNFYLAPSSTKPKYKVSAGISGVGRIIEISPSTMFYSRLQYRFIPADLTASSSTLDVPVEYEELVMLDVMTRTYTMLKEQAQSKDANIEYETKVKLYQTGYSNLLTSILGDKMRLQSNDLGK